MDDSDFPRFASSFPGVSMLARLFEKMFPFHDGIEARESHNVALRQWNRRMTLATASLGCALSLSLMMAPAYSDPPSHAQSPGLTRTVPPIVPARLENASLRHQAASSFIESISDNDGSFDVIVGHGRTIAIAGELVDDLNENAAPPVIAVGDPSVVDYVIVGGKSVRVVGRRIGITDLSITTSKGLVYTYQIHVVLDLKLIEARMRQLFPDAHIRLAHLGRKLIVEGMARDSLQLSQISEVLQKTVEATVNIEAKSGSTPTGAGAGGGAAGRAAASDGEQAGIPTSPGSGAASQATVEHVEVINLMRVPGPQQVMLQVQVAELDRTAMRQIGSDLLFNDGHGTTLGSRLIPVTDAGSTLSSNILTGAAAATATGGASTTAFGIGEGVGFHAFISALRRNTLLNILAEPNLVAMHGHQASFLAGGEFPVPVPQSGAGGGPATITIEYKKFGVQLAFVPYILDGDIIRLEVDPEVSSIDFELGTEISGVKVPGINTRRSHTVVEMREGQTLAIAGLMQLDLAGTTSRLPGLGDLPYIGPFFSNTTGKRVEKELLVLVTPHLVEPMSPDQVGPLPGAEVYEPNDLEFFLLGRIEGHTHHPEFRSTTHGEDPWGCYRRMKVECHYVQGPHGFSD